MWPRNIRAIYTFHDDTGTFHVYKYHKGYPQESIGFIKSALKEAFKERLTSAGDLAVSFLIANKWPNSGCGLMEDCYQHDDLDYRYAIEIDFEKEKEIFFELETGEFFQGNILISAFKRNHNYCDGEIDYDLIFSGSLEEFGESYEYVVLKNEPSLIKIDADNSKLLREFLDKKNY